MSKKIYVGNLSYKTDEDSLRSAFDPIGEVLSVRIIKDPAGRSKGFGFVEMTSAEDADRAISNLNGTNFMGRNIIVNEAKPQTEKGGSGASRKPSRVGRDQLKRR